MTRINYGDYGGRYYFEASGHAVSESIIPDCGCDEKEQSAVCAAISILVLCAAQRLQELNESGELIHFSAELESGYACFDVTSRDTSDEEVSRLFETVMCGMELLEENYPELLSCE